MKLLAWLAIAVLGGCAADQAATPTSEVGVTVLPLGSARSPEALAQGSTKPDATSTPPAARDPEAAERYFVEAKGSMGRGQVEEACALLQKSMDADPALGTMLNLGDCNERLGNIPAACNAYRDVQAQATASGQDARGEVARSRAEKLGCR